MKRHSGSLYSATRNAQTNIATFPEPDLPIVEVSREWLAEIRAKLPALPDELQQRYIKDMELSAYDAGVLTAERAVAQYFQDVVESGAEPKLAANWLTTGSIPSYEY